MKNKLLGTTAITAFIAAGIMVASSGARGAENIPISVGGYFKAYLAAMRQDDGTGQPGANRRGTRLAREGDIKFSDQTNVVAPPAAFTSLSGVSEKITYFTPRMSGFQLGMFYTPENCGENTASSNCTTAYSGEQGNRTAGQHSAFIEVGANYVRNIGALDLGLYAGYGKSNLEAATVGTADQEHWGLGVELGYQSFTFGADYREDNQGTSAANTGRTDYSMGVTYAMGNWILAAGYAHGEVGAGAGLGLDETDGYQVGLNYDLAPGITLTGGLSYWDVEANLDAAASENTATQFVIGTLLSF
ncbi:MAG: porin [Alphaproteobacteria bacterium]